tara:strand:+ start:459 stop:890 length:432 start_codon:yes stop_codon:yes gene_type:complete
MEYTHLPRKILDPYWGNQEKTQVICKFSYEGGPIVEAAVSDTKDGNPDWKEIFQTFTVEEVDDLTENTLKERLENHELRKSFAKDEEARAKNDILFDAKLDAFEIEVIKNSKNRDYKSNIRKAKTLVEVMAYTSALIILENEK